MTLHYWIHRVTFTQRKRVCCFERKKGLYVKVDGNIIVKKFVQLFQVKNNQNTIQKNRNSTVQ